MHGSQRSVTEQHFRNISERDSWTVEQSRYSLLNPDRCCSLSYSASLYRILLLICCSVKLGRCNLWPLDDEQNKLCDLWLLLWCSAVRVPLWQIFLIFPESLLGNPPGSEGNRLIPPPNTLQPLLLPFSNLKGPLHACWLQARSHTRSRTQTLRYSLYTHTHNHLLLHLNMALGSLSVILWEERRPLGHSCVSLSPIWYPATRREGLGARGLPRGYSRALKDMRHGQEMLPLSYTKATTSDRK